MRVLARSISSSHATESSPCKSTVSGQQVPKPHRFGSAGTLARTARVHACMTVLTKINEHQSRLGCSLETRTNSSVSSVEEGYRRLFVLLSSELILLKKDVILHQAHETASFQVSRHRNRIVWGQHIGACGARARVHDRAVRDHRAPVTSRLFARDKDAQLETRT